MEKRKKETAPKATNSDRFTEALRKTLEHVTDADWLEKSSSLASVFFAGTHVSETRQRQVTLTGRTEIDDRLRTIWHEWETRVKIPLQSILWEAVCQLPADSETSIQATLLLTYFDENQPKQSQVIKLLAIGRSTYYRYLEKGVELLAKSITKILRPSLQLEMPKARPLVGRENEIAQAQAVLASGEIVHLIGGSGLGKTSLGAYLASQWPHGVFWYTFRPGLTDYLEHFLYAVAYFLHEQGQSGLWLYLTTSSETISPGKAILALRQHLNQLSKTPPLFCLDEVDLLLPDDLHDSEEHAMLRALLEDWSQGDRASSPLVFIGQKLLLEPTQSGLLHLSPFTTAELSVLAQVTGTTLTVDQAEHLISSTRGNPLLLRLFTTLFQQTNSVMDVVEKLTTTINLGWFLTRLANHLTPKEHIVLYELSVFSDSAPKNGWVRTRKHLDALVNLGLVEELSNDNIRLHPALQQLIYGQLPQDRKYELHLAAGHLLAERGKFTAAARHYMAAQFPELAVWIWYTHQEAEVNQGQASAALAFFATIDKDTLATAEDQRAFALLIAPLLLRAGRYREGITQVERPTWQPNTVTSAIAHELRGELFAEVGDVERSLVEFRQSLNSISKLRITHEVDLRLKIARRAFAYQREVNDAASEIEQAELMLQILKCNIETRKGNYDLARSYYTEALDKAERCKSTKHLAMLNESLGILEARRGNLDASIAHFRSARDHHQAVGDVVSASGLTDACMAFAYLYQRRYAEAIEPAEKSLAFFQELKHAYWIAINETYLAEAWLNLDDLEKAERYAQSALRQEEVAVRPYCLFLLGHVRRRQQHFTEAERFCQEAIEIAEEFEDPGALAPAWSALGETLRDAGQPDEARAALQESLSFWKRVENQLEIEQTEALLEELSSDLVTA